MTKRAIWKSVIPFADKTFITIPKGAMFRYLGTQGSDIVIWYECEPAAPTFDLKLRIFGTGFNGLEDVGDYLGTVQMSNGMVWHIYEEDD